MYDKLRSPSGAWLLLHRDEANEEHVALHGGRYGHGVEVGSGAAAEAKHEVKGRLLLDVVIRKSATVLELLAGEDQALLVWRDALLVLDPELGVSKRRAEPRSERRTSP